MDSMNVHENPKLLVDQVRPLADQLALLDRFIFDSEDWNFIEKLADLPVIDVCSRLLEEDTLSNTDGSRTSGFQALEGIAAAMENLSKVINKEKAVPESSKGETATNVKDSVVSVLLALCDALMVSSILNKKDSDALFMECLKYLQNLEHAVLDDEVISDLKDFLHNFSNCLFKMKTRFPDLRDIRQKNVVQLCIHQIKKCLPLLLAILKTKRISADHPTKCCQESKRYILRRINCCLTDLQDNLEGISGAPGSQPRQHRELVETTCGQFVILVDEALSLLSMPISKSTESKGPNAQVSPKQPGHEICDHLSSKVEKILCHAFSVSHIAISPKDGQAIVSCGQQVLKELQLLKDSCASTSGNDYERNLHASNLSDALFCVEQKVNTALLRVVVEVFGDPCASLGSLIEASTCPDKDGSVSGRGAMRQAEDLEDLIANYDLQMDRVMQIGVFAISCSNDRKRIPGIRCCLASLESLEPELVPTAVSLYLNNSSECKASHLRFLAAHWRQEVACLQYLLDGIVDPLAFSRVTYEELHKLIAYLKELLKDVGNRGSMAGRTVVRIITRAQRLLDVFRHEGSDFLKSQSILISDFEFSIAECRAAHKIAFYGTGVTNSSSAIKVGHKDMQRVVQRCLLIASMVKKLEGQMSEQSSVLSQCTLRKSLRSFGNSGSPKPHRIGDSLLMLPSPGPKGEVE